MDLSLEEKLKQLPEGPGVYLMKDAAGKVIYVGKALNLKNRVRTYFQSSLTGEKTRALVSHIRDLEWILTDSEMEALILECSLIKKYRPRYNIRLMDDKGYPYIRVTVQEDFPRVEAVHRMEEDRARYFGPYTSSGAVRETLKLIRRIFPLRTCQNSAGWEKQQRPCLNHQLGRCPAPCKGLITKEEYAGIIDRVILFLEGKQESLCQLLEKRMEQAAENLAFEEAARLRDQLQSVRQVLQRQKVLSDKREDYDAVNYARGKSQVCVQVFYVREGKLLGRESFFLEGQSGGEDVLLPFLGQYYSRVPRIPPVIYIPQPEAAAEAGSPAAEAGSPAAEAGSLAAEEGSGAAEAGAPAQEAAAAESGSTAGALAVTEAWLSSLRGRRVRIRTPKRGEKKDLLDLVAKNARDQLQQKEGREAAREDSLARGLRELRDVLGLAELPHRMECYDISHISGTETVASMAVAIDGRTRPGLYRRFRIRQSEGNNDFASMAEVVLRRFARERQQDSRFGALPDLVVIDGGKGQLSSARSVMEVLGVGHIAAVGLAERFEWIYLPDRPEPIVLDPRAPGLLLITHLRDEAHRFAITYHRLLRGKRSLTSVLDEIPGLGPKGKKALLQGFELSLKKIMGASLEELERTPGLTKKSARAVYDWCHPQE